MFILDSLLISGLRFVFDKVATAVDAELDDDTVLREELLAAEMRREMGEISDEEFARTEADLLARIREIKERREGGSGPIAFGQDEGTRDSELHVEATVSGDFHEAARPDAPQTERSAGASRTIGTRTSRSSRRPRNARSPR